MKRLYAMVFAWVMLCGVACAGGFSGVAVDLTARAAAATADGKAVAALAAVLPVGAVYDFAGSTCPSGSLIVPTTAGNISRTTYAALFAAIGTTWGAGDGSTTFGRPYIPANYAAVQSSSNVGTSTVGEVISHTHAFSNSVPFVGLSGWNIQISAGALGSGAGNATNATGGTANLAAGVRFLKCVKT